MSSDYLQWVNHASYIITTPTVKLITDPWLEGKAFDNGWSLISPTKLNYDQFKNISHIWFSHEHPDHFSPPVLFKIPEEYRKKITVLYQECKDGKVIDFCKKIGFKTKILPRGKWVKVSDDLDIICHPFHDGDSWMATRLKDHTLLNLNDCVITEPAQLDTIRTMVGNVDILLTQFSYAAWHNTKSDREMAAAEVLKRIRTQFDMLRPKAIIPFASFVSFSHCENKFMNDSINRIDTAHENISAYCPCHVFYPGDIWNLSDEIDSRPAIDLYLEDMQNEPEYYPSAPPINFVDLQEKAGNFIEKLCEAHSEYVIKRQKKVKIYLSDCDQFCTLSPDGLMVAEGNDYDIVIASQPLAYMFDNLWGGGTLLVNGRFSAKSNSDPFTNYAYLSIKANAAIRVTSVEYWAKLIKKYFLWYKQKLE